MTARFPIALCLVTSASLCACLLMSGCSSSSEGPAAIDAGGDRSGGQGGTGGLAPPVDAGTGGGAGTMAGGGSGGNDASDSGDAMSAPGADTVSDRAAADGGSQPDGGASDAPLFNPCPTSGSPCAIMPLGDSITFADLAPGAGYRVALFRLAGTDGKAITFVGSQTNGPTTVDGKPFPRQNEGHSGYIISGGANGIAELVDASLAMYKPNIVLLMIGTNDVDRNLNLPNAPARLGALLDKIIQDAPAALLVVAKMVPGQNDGFTANVRAYNDAIPALVQQRVAAGKHVAMVDMYTAFTANPNYKTALLRDALHPTLAGYDVMGQVWYAALKNLLPPAP
jgi:lysophospholipase L1-like esterase